jgi:WD40 repeat protein
LQVWGTDSYNTSAFVRDACRFISTFCGLISQSCPHIYLSALPFAPEKSLVSQTYLKKYPRVLRVQYGKASDWPAIRNVLYGHLGEVRSIAFSPDGRYIASGSMDMTIRVWDAETGDVVSRPFERHTAGVTSVAFSPDGKQIASGSRDRTIQIWDAETGDIVSGPLEGHTDAVTSVVYSPDGKHIASGSYDSTIRIWDAAISKVAIILHSNGFGVRSVTFSSDGSRIASSQDATIQIWNAETGNIVLGPFEAHTDAVSSVAFSPDGQYIASGSHDTTIKIWDAETGNYC